MSEARDPFGLLPPLPASAAHLQLASRQARLIAAVVDLALSTVPALLLLLLVTLLGGGGAPEPVDADQAMVSAVHALGWFLGAIVAALAWMLLVVAVQSVLIGLRGQTVGKMLTGCRIVKLDGSPCGFWTGVVTRWWLLSTVGAVLSIVGVGFVVWLFDYVAIFQDDRRCLHDHLGGTVVVVA